MQKRSGVGACVTCGIAQKDQHSNREAGICAALKRRIDGRTELVGADGEVAYTAPRYKKGDRKAA